MTTTDIDGHKCDVYCSKPGQLVLEDVITVPDGNPWVFRYYMCPHHRTADCRKTGKKRVLISETPDELLIARWCRKDSQ